jgi:hypothetical protein
MTLARDALVGGGTVIRDDELEDRLRVLRLKAGYIELVGQEQGSPGDPLVWVVRNHTDEGLCSAPEDRWSYEDSTPHGAVCKAWNAYHKGGL